MDLYTLCKNYTIEEKYVLRLPVYTRYSMNIYKSEYLIYQVGPIVVYCRSWAATRRRARPYRAYLW